MIKIRAISPEAHAFISRLLKHLYPRAGKNITVDREDWVLSDLASKQNLFHVFDGLTKITSDLKYRQAAFEAIEYAFANLSSPNGLL